MERARKAHYRMAAVRAVEGAAQEFGSLLLPNGEVNTDTVHRVFRLFDADGNGHIDQSESAPAWLPLLSCSVHSPAQSGSAAGEKCSAMYTPARLACLPLSAAFVGALSAHSSFTCCENKQCMLLPPLRCHHGILLPAVDKASAPGIPYKPKPADCAHMHPQLLIQPCHDFGGTQPIQQASTLSAGQPEVLQTAILSQRMVITNPKPPQAHIHSTCS